ncbi:hypothetical protein E1B28_009168 [Marasmius oreades]|uniref:DDE Tnp4 domain-containing protein n=1 Tax=Marasmius oreades TaxID=181124 RepID=A0A9P7USW0_9AGAR|nr:uncharacterized protein E1B28_009168 [Marasmius oreades]KAG7092853.1 hypothetical protein E1B28_009168 [Marasmius oreades]
MHRRFTLLTSSVSEIHLQQIFALVPSVLSHYLDFSLDILLEVLKNIEEARIKLPQSTDEFEDESILIQERHPRLVGAFGSIDGLSLPVQVSDDVEIENATYNGRKTEHRINNILAFSPRGVIIDVVLNAPGSWHDAHVTKPIFDCLHTHVPEGYYLVSDTAFPHSTSSISGKIKAPLKAGEHVPSDPAEQAELLAFNHQLLSYQQTPEWGMRAMQGSFGRLWIPLPIGSKEDHFRLLEICCRLFNIRANCVGINQIKSVYMPVWCAGEDERMWNDMGNMLFGEIRK